MKQRLSFFSKNYNIIILILILIILFVFGKIIINKKSIIDTQNASQYMIDKTNREVLDNKENKNNFFIYIIHEVFPKNHKLSINSKGIINNVLTTFIDNIFKIDIKNPVTIVQAQFPIEHISDIEISHEIETENQDEFENDFEDDYREIFFVDLKKEDKSMAVGTVPQERYDEDMEIDDIGDEKGKEIYIFHGEYIDENIVDSIVRPGVTEPEKITFEKGKPHVLIYHTHGTESYNPASEGNYHTLRKEYSVIEVGRIITEILEKRGYNVIHDETYHDYPSYSGSYGRSLAKAREILKENPSIKVIIDIHRDGYDNLEDNKKKALMASNRTNIDENVSTKFQLVIGPESPNRKEVEIFANYIKSISDINYPGFSKPILVKPYGKFNQFLSNHYALIEVGSNLNNIEEAKKSATYLGEILAETLDNIKK